MPKVEALQKHTNEYDNWFVFLSEIETVEKYTTVQ